MRSTINIRFRGENLEKRLSNLYPYQFEFDGITYASMEAFFSSLRTPDFTEKQKLYTTYGLDSWYKGHKFSWNEKQEVYYKDKAINRHSTDHENLITAAFDALCTNEDFKQALRESGNCKLTHTIGKTAKDKTLLTRKEFISHLNQLRTKLNERKFFDLSVLFFQ
jgi:hypothetical protein